MKRKILGLIIILMISIMNIMPLTANAVVSSVNSDEYIKTGKEKLVIKDRKIVSKETGNEFIMKGVSNSLVWTDFLEGKISRDAFKLLKDNGFNSSRLMLFTEMFYNLKTDQFVEEGFEKLKYTLNNAQEEGIYIIVDMHALTYGKLHFRDDTGYCMVSENGTKYTDAFIKVWTRIAKEVKDYNCVLAYELMNEPHCYYETTQKAVLEVYTDLIQRTFDAIRREDLNTIISFQPINGYLKGENYNWAEITETRYPKIKGENILLDVTHFYDNTFYKQPYGVLNEVPAWGAESINRKYIDGQNTYMTDTKNTFSIDLEGNVDTQLVYGFLKVFNNEGSNVTVHGYRIYKLVGDEEVKVFEIQDTDSYEKQRVFSYDDLIGKTYEISGDEIYLFGYDHLLIKNPIGIKKGEKIRLEIDTEFDKINEGSYCRMYCGVMEVTPNKEGQTLVSGYEKLLAQIKGLDEIAKEYNSPLYLGEVGIRTYLINDYTNYKQCIDDYMKLSEQYHINNNWHQMLQLSDQGSGTGYGIFLGKVPKEEGKQKDVWKYVIPKYLSVSGAYKNENVVIEEKKDDKKENQPDVGKSEDKKQEHEEMPDDKNKGTNTEDINKEQDQNTNLTDDKQDNTKKSSEDAEKDKIENKVISTVNDKIEEDKNNNNTNISNNNSSATTNTNSNVNTTVSQNSNTNTTNNNSSTTSTNNNTSVNNNDTNNNNSQNTANKLENNNNQKKDRKNRSTIAKNIEKNTVASTENDVVNNAEISDSDDKIEDFNYNNTTVADNDTNIAEDDSEIKEKNYAKNNDDKKYSTSNSKSNLGMVIFILVVIIAIAVFILSR